jgi:demethylmenaquinone methyltransferase/2-methoxy-6-polyprenyl-1,4-benzoquinol methylase
MALHSEADSAAAGVDKRRYVRRIFSEIAPRYDLLNHVLSLNVDRGWRRRAIAALGWEGNPGGTYLDLCAGTLDVAVELARQPGFRGAVIGADFAEPMLFAGGRKAPRETVSPVVADAVELPLRDGSVAGGIVAFGIRNLVDLDAGLREAWRVIAPGGRFVVLEFTTPDSAFVRAAYHAYFHHVLPAVGGAVSGHRSAYQYLPRSVEHFPDAEAFADRMRGAGFSAVRWKRLSMGIAALHVGDRA